MAVVNWRGQQRVGAQAGKVVHGTAGVRPGGGMHAEGRQQLALSSRP